MVSTQLLAVQCEDNSERPVLNLISEFLTLAKFSPLPISQLSISSHYHLNRESLNEFDIHLTLFDHAFIVTEHSDALLKTHRSFYLRVFIREYVALRFVVSNVANV